MLLYKGSGNDGYHSGCNITLVNVLQMIYENHISIKPDTSSLTLDEFISKFAEKNNRLIDFYFDKLRNSGITSKNRSISEEELYNEKISIYNNAVKDRDTMLYDYLILNGINVVAVYRNIHDNRWVSSPYDIQYALGLNYDTETRIIVNN